MELQTVAGTEHLQTEPSDSKWIKAVMQVTSDKGWEEFSRMELQKLDQFCSVWHWWVTSIYRRENKVQSFQLQSLSFPIKVLTAKVYPSSERRKHNWIS